MCSLGFMVKVGVFESGEICWNTLWWADSSPCLAFVVALSSDGREVHRHAQREVSVGFLREIQSNLHTCCCLGKLEYLWLSTKTGGFFHSWMWPLLCPRVTFFSFPAWPFPVCCATSHPFTASEQRLVCSTATLTWSQPGDSRAEGRKCHFGVHHGNQKQPPFLSNACCVRSSLWLCLVCRQQTISGLHRFSSALQFLSCWDGSTQFLFAVRIWSNEYSRTVATNQLRHVGN